MCIPIHSPWLPGYIDITQTVLMLTMAGIFPDKPCSHSLSCLTGPFFSPQVNMGSYDPEQAEEKWFGRLGPKQKLVFSLK